MQYIDPYALFKLDVQGPEGVTKERLRRVKQRLLAEFELSDDIVIEMGGVKMDKSTALKLLEEMENPEQARLYWYLHSNPQLADFLQNEKLRYLRYLPQGEKLGDKDFRKFLSKRLAPIFDRHLSENIRKGRRPEVSLILQRLDLIDSWDLDDALKSSVRFFNQNVQEIKHLAGDPVELRKAKTDHLYEAEQVKLLNRFPRVYQHLRNRYADALRELAETYENKLNATHTAYAVICVAAELDTDISTSEYINYLKVELWRRKRTKDQQSWTRSHEEAEPTQDTWTEERNTQSSSGPASSPSSSSSGRNSLWVAAVILLAVISLFRLCSRSSSTSYSSSDLPSSIVDLDWDLPSATSIFERTRNPHLFLFDSLSAASEQSYRGKDEPVQPDTIPYSTQIFDVDLSWFNVPRIEFRNQSEFDAVIFFMDASTSKIKYHRYVGAQSTLEFDKIPTGEFWVQMYLGREWRDDAVSYFGRKIPGFSQDPLPVTDEHRQFEEGGTTFVMMKDDVFSVDNERIDKVMVLNYDFSLSLTTK